LEVFLSATPSSSSHITVFVVYSLHGALSYLLFEVACVSVSLLSAQKLRSIKHQVPLAAAALDSRAEPSLELHTA
jgi:hypothetical protein